MITNIKNILSKTYYAAEAEAALSRTSAENKDADRKTISVLVVAAVCLALSKYLSDPYYLYKFISLFNFTQLSYQTDSRLLELGWWVLILFIFYFIVPALLIKIYLKEKLSGYGLKFKGAFKDHYLYVVMLVVMIPLVIFFSGTASFQARYPFYTIGKFEPLFPHFFEWELMYLLQFCALEFFFRGFLVHGTKHRFGFYSVFVMTIPYCMIHFGKPLPETIAAIIAGVILGILSLKSRSILLGIAIHYSVAITMDLAALWQKGLL